MRLWQSCLRCLLGGSQLTRSMAQQLLERLQAARILTEDAPSSARQSAACVAMVDGLRLTTSDVIAITGAVSAVPWALPEHGTQIMDRVAMCRIDGLSSVGRAKQQNFEALSYFLTPNMWRVLLHDGYEMTGKLRILCDHAYGLGLTNPSEPTYQRMAALLIVAHHGPMASRTVPQQALQEMLASCKEEWRKTVRGGRRNEKMEQRIAQLPASALELKESHPFIFNRVFGDGPHPLPPQVTDMDLQATARRIWMRRSGGAHAAATPPTDGNMSQMFQFMQSMLPLMNVGGNRSSNREHQSGIAAGDIPIQFFQQARGGAATRALTESAGAPAGSAARAASAPAGAEAMASATAGVAAAASATMGDERREPPALEPAPAVKHEATLEVKREEPTTAVKEPVHEPVRQKTPEEAAAILLSTIGARKAEDKAAAKAGAAAAKAGAAMKRPAGADKGMAKKPKTAPPEDGVAAPSWYDAKSRHHILFKTGFTGKGSTKTLTYHSEAEKAERIEEAKALVKERNPHIKCNSISGILTHASASKFSSLEILWKRLALQGFVIRMGACRRNVSGVASTDGWRGQPCVMKNRK